MDIIVISFLVLMGITVFYVLRKGKTPKHDAKNELAKLTTKPPEDVAKP